MAKTSLMEWIEQTKKLSKSKDYFILELIDFIYDNIFFIDKKILLKYEYLINKYCKKYHKPNPLFLIKSTKKTDMLFKEKHKGKSLGIFWKENICIKGNKCNVKKNYKKCKAFLFMKKICSSFIDKSLKRSEHSEDILLWQWFEIIDLMYERPELVNPAILDVYISEKINTVCKKYNKNNPLKNGMLNKFGKYWKNKQGKLTEERRKRF